MAIDVFTGDIFLGDPVFMSCVRVLSRLDVFFVERVMRHLSVIKGENEEIGQY